MARHHNQLTLFIALSVAASVAMPYSDAFAQSAQCHLPREYTIGTIDPRFNLSSTSLKTNLRTAEQIWETAAGKNMFEFSTSSSAMPIHLAYDGRQDAIIRLHREEMTIAAIRAVFTKLETAHAALIAETKTRRLENVTQFSGYQADVTTFNADVARVNSAGGATPTEASALTARQIALEKKFADLKSVEAELNTRVTTLNAISAALNQVVAALNAYVLKHNVESDQLGSFEQGYYRRDGSVESIGIYAFADESQLARVLAHELGHSLGMRHVDDPEAILNAVNKGSRLAATAADMQELHRVCP